MPDRSLHPEPSGSCPLLATTGPASGNCCLIITQNGEAKVVMQDIDSYEQTQETVALLKVLALGIRQVEAGRVQPAADVVARLRERRQTG